jgi:hypothetical protein
LWLGASIFDLSAGHRPANGYFAVEALAVIARRFRGLSRGRFGGYRVSLCPDGRKNVLGGSDMKFSRCRLAACEPVVNEVHGVFTGRVEKVPLLISGISGAARQAKNLIFHQIF